MIFPTTPNKVVKADGYLIAVCGAAIVTQSVQKIVKEQGHEIDVLNTISSHLEEKDTDCSILSVSYDRKLVHMDGHGCMSSLEVDYWAVGCAEWYVLGRLHLIEETRPITVEDAKAAIVAAAKYDNGIDARVQEFYLDRV
jgi:hypothetical protein